MFNKAQECMCPHEIIMMALSLRLFKQCMEDFIRFSTERVIAEQVSYAGGEVFNIHAIVA